MVCFLCFPGFLLSLLPGLAVKSFLLRRSGLEAQCREARALWVCLFFKFFLFLSRCLSKQRHDCILMGLLCFNGVQGWPGELLQTTQVICALLPNCLSILQIPEDPSDACAAGAP